MRSGWRVGPAAVAAAIAIGVACGGGSSDRNERNVIPPDGGSADGSDGSDAGSDAGVADAGQDGGATDGGTNAWVPIVPPTLGASWTFYGTAEGMPPNNVMGVTADEDGNVYVAGGDAGLLVQRGGQGAFHAYGIADGLHPYGYLMADMAKLKGVPEGSPSDPNPSLAATPVMSVAGGKGGTVFVGYQGKPGCEDAWKWDQWSKPSDWGDPAVYKSGDADKVTLAAAGSISVVHYDIFSGPGVVDAEPGGREKLCSIWRIVYQHGTNYVWFGANHGFAFGKADFAGNPICNGQVGCAGVWEHVHPAFNDSVGDLVTQDYWGVAVDPLSQGGFHDVWFGGMARTTRFRFGETGGSYWNAQPLTEAWTKSNINDPAKAAFKAAWQNRVDVWPDDVGEYDSSGNPTFPTPAQWNDGLDLVSGIAADPADNSVYIASFAHGIRHLGHDGNFLGDITTDPKNFNKGLFANNVSAIAIDTDGSLWVGYKYEGGISRIHKGGVVEHYANVLGPQLEKSAVVDIQISPTSPRKVLFAFQSGAVGVYEGN